MPKISLRDIVEATGGSVRGAQNGAGSVAATGYSFDTRTLRAGDLFFALHGGERNGHSFLEHAASKGAVGAVVEEPVSGLPERFPQIVVPSALDALQKLAGWVRDSLDLPIIAISGSNGKTTTKEMLAGILSSKFRVHKSPGNFNNHIGVPMSILGLDPADEVLVMELGSNHRGEIRKLCAVARPTIGVITNVGRAHIGYFGSIEEIAREKTDILRALETGGGGAVNGDDAALMAALDDVDVNLMRFGTGEGVEFQATGIERIAGSGSAFMVSGTRVKLAAPGIHNVYNALAAIAASSLLGISVGGAAGSLERFRSVRMRTFVRGGITVIDDAYNSNPDSVRAALDSLSNMPAERRVFVMGEMLELGSETTDLHREVGRMVAASGIDVLIGIAGHTHDAVGVAREHGMGQDEAFYVKDNQEAKRLLGGMLRAGDVVLVKGSRMTGLDDVCRYLERGIAGGRA
jgi:UDP-N-acetylmuramoyl-tripeptide--D-alanyl-D-alanine ligase